MIRRKEDAVYFDASSKLASGRDDSKDGQGITKVRVINLDRSNTDLAVTKLETAFTRKQVEEMLREGQMGSTELPPGHI